jgi:hypothetical protein
MKNKFLILIAFLFSTAIFTGCEKDDPEIELTATMPVSGLWYVTYKVADKVTGALTDVRGGHVKLNTFNTAANTPNEIWVTDEDPDFADNGPLYTFWNYKVRANLDLASKTFSANSKSIALEDVTEGAPYDINVIITEGKVIDKGGRSKTGVEVDSIYFKVQFEDDPDTLTYIVSGHRRTGFLEDEYTRPK